MKYLMSHNLGDTRHRKSLSFENNVVSLEGKTEEVLAGWIDTATKVNLVHSPLVVWTGIRLCLVNMQIISAVNLSRIQFHSVISVMIDMNICRHIAFVNVIFIALLRHKSSPAADRGVTTTLFHCKQFINHPLKRSYFVHLFLDMFLTTQELHDGFNRSR